MSLKGLECRVSKSANSDACPCPTTDHGADFPREDQVVAGAEAVLQIERAAAAAQPALGQDGDGVAEHVRLVHEVRGEDHGSGEQRPAAV